MTQNNNTRFVLFPIEYNDIWQAYKDAEASFWTAEEVDLAQDLSHWKNLTAGERHFISHVLAFFAASDGIVGENLALRFYGDVVIPEARAFYGFQLMMEGIHSEMYSLLIDTYISDPEEKNRLFNAIDNIEIISKKAEWTIKWIESEEDLAKRIIAFAIVEGVFFSSSFCSIYWLKQRGIMPGLAFSNELISRDEGAHTDFACLLYKTLQKNGTIKSLSQEDVHAMFKESVELEIEFACDALPVDLIGMNKGMMSDYIKFVSDRLIQSLGYEKLYKVSNPFDFMEMISLQSKSNFFEKRVGDYRKAGVGNTKEDNKITFDADF
jgi:ribonucleoside-diphosphate reductase beta chain